MTTRSVRKPDRRRERIRRYRERERLDGIDPDDEAARWLEENDPERKKEQEKER